MCEVERAGERLKEAVNRIDETHIFYCMKENFNILLNGPFQDIFSAEIRYHKSCYKCFTYRKDLTEYRIYKRKCTRMLCMILFAKIDVSILQRSKARLLNDLLNDC